MERFAQVMEDLGSRQPKSHKHNFREAQDQKEKKQKKKKKLVKNAGCLIGEKMDGTKEKRSQERVGKKSNEEMRGQRTWYAKI